MANIERYCAKGVFDPLAGSIARPLNIPVRVENPSENPLPAGIVTRPVGLMLSVFAAGTLSAALEAKLTAALPNMNSGNASVGRS